MRSARSQQRGSVLMLMPAAVLVVIVLTSIALEFAAVSMRQRALYNAADAAANDAATSAIDHARLRADGTIVIDPELAREVVLRSLADQRIELSEPPVIEVIGNDTISIEVAAHVDYIVARALPGPDGTTVRAHVRVTAHESP